MGDAAAIEDISLEESDTGRQQNQRPLKRPAAAGSHVARKQQVTATSIAPPTLSPRLAPAGARGNEGADNVTYRLVQITSPDTQNLTRQQTVGQNATAHVIATNGQGELIFTRNQQLVLNSSGGLTVGTAAMQESAPPKLTYVPANAISLATNTSTVNQAIQLPMESGSGQYYIMVPTGTDLASSPVAVSTPAPAPSRIIAAPRLQRAAFIPLSRLQPAQTSLNHFPTPATVVKHLDFQSGESSVPHKEVKRRVSHNEVEKRRRDKINHWIGKLSTIVPHCSNEYSAAKIAQSKGGVLGKTVDYIEELRETNEHLIDALRHYESISGCLKEENKQLRELLERAGIETPQPLAFDFPTISDLLSPVTCSRQSASPPATSSATSATAAEPVNTGDGAMAGGSDDGPFSGTASATVVSLSNEYIVVQTDKGLSLIRSAAPEQNSDQNNQEEHASGSDYDDHPGQV